MNRYIRVYFFPGMLLLALSIAFLFFVKNRVQEISRDLRSVNSQILSEREAIHVLRAEYSFLTNPKRLKKLTEKSLSLQAPKKDQVLEQSQISTYLSQFVEKEQPPKPTVETQGEGEN